MRVSALGLILLGFSLVAVSLGLKAFFPGDSGDFDLSPGESMAVEKDVLTLKMFSVPKYPSGKARQYVSAFHILDESGKMTHHETRVNHPCRWKGWWIYQSSYDAAHERYTVLHFFRDPWLTLAAIGGALILLGAFTNCFARRSAICEGGGLKAKKIAGMVLAVLLVSIPLFIIARAVFRPEPPPALQSIFMAPHIAAYAVSYIILLFAACGVGCRLVPVGFLLMTIGLELGAIWGKFCWGDFWQYDPKEMWSLAAWATYVFYFIFESRPRLSRALLIVGAVLIILTATWVNFSRMFPGLHNYAAVCCKTQAELSV